MNSATMIPQEATAHATRLDDEAIKRAIEHAVHLLPAQGPITAFVHHNTLHAFEDLDFDSAVRKGARIFGCHPYLPESQYRDMLSTGRIRDEDIDAVLIEKLDDRADDLLGSLGTRFGLYRAILKHVLHDGPSVDLRWVIGDTNALNCFREEASEDVKKQCLADTRRWVMRELRMLVNPQSDADSPTKANAHRVPAELLDSYRQVFELFDLGAIEKWSNETWESFTLHLLWTTCEFGARQAGSEEAGVPSSPRVVRHRDGLLEVSCHDPDELVHELLIPFSAAFLDQGFSSWPLTNRESGFFQSFTALYGSASGFVKPWRRGLAAELQRHRRENIQPLESIRHSLQELGVKPEELDSFVSHSLLALRGFAGMIWQLEDRGDRVHRAMPPGTLTEFLAIRLILDRFAFRHVANTETSFRGELAELRNWLNEKLSNDKLSRTGQSGISQQQRTAFRIFELSQILNWRPRILSGHHPRQWKQIVDELNQFTGTDRREILHLAFERKYRNETLDAVLVHARRTKALKRAEQKSLPDFQMVNCIDEREESFRRHLEEVYPNCETFGAAGFFAIPMYYRGAADAHYTPLCPVVIKPDHHVREEVVYSLKQHASKRKRARRTIGTVTHRVHIGSRTFTGGWLGTALLGSLATFPLVLRILFPRMTARLRMALGGFVEPPEVTRLQLERDPQFPPGPSKEQIGFTVDEMANTVERLLRDIGATNNFARLFFVCGHGSASLNNPHEAAHDCGACAGGRGGPNARAFAQMANDRRVRALVADRGLLIPDETVFVGCYHNTCDDSVTYYDLDQIPGSHQDEFERALEAIEEARKRDAHERSRRFESGALDLSFDDALKHVEGRAEDLSQVRPEYGHATNALCFVGHRNWNRGLFLDRRAFLQSYDPAQDDENFSILERILQAVIPVCAGINLEYYFSFVDPVGYGCGTKLPHNITSLIGVMNGAGSDLRPGLPWQMVEIHEPVRLLFVIEATTEAMEKIIANNPAIEKLCNGDWVQLAVFDVDSTEVYLYRNQRFEPYRPESEVLDSAANSVDWYRGWRDHLKFASVGAEFAEVMSPEAGGRDGP